MVLSNDLIANLKKLLAPFGLIIFTFLVYYPTLFYGFIFDDLPTIVEYIHVRKIDFWGQWFHNPRWISRVLNQITFAYWKDNPTAYRIFNLGLHLILGLMIFYFLLTVLSGYKKSNFIRQNAYLISLFTMILFLLHPVQTQTVTYITQMRIEGLVVFFSFALLICFVNAALAKNKILKYCLYSLSLIMAAFSAGTKEIAVVLPSITIIVDWFFVAQGDWNDFKNRIPLHLAYSFIIFGLFFRYGYLVPRNIATTLTTPVHNNRGNILTPTSQEFITTYYYFISQFKVLLHYIWIFLFPVNLCFDYDYKLSIGLLRADVIVPVLILLFILCSVLYRLWNNLADLFSFGVIWFFIFMLPRASFFISTELICDYKTYPASFGILFLLSCLFVMVISAAPKFIKINNFFYAQPATILALICILAVATKTRNYVWSSELLFWKDAAEKTGKARCYHNYANAYADLGDIKTAMHFYQEAINRDNFYAEPHINLGLMHQNMGQDDVALEHYKRALEIGEGHPELFNNLGILNMKHGAFDQAENCFKQALALKPYHSSALFNFGNLWYLRGDIKEAEKYFEAAMNGNTSSPQLFYMYGVVCFETGQLERAVKLLENVKADYQKTAFYLGASYFGLRNYKKAVEFLGQAHKTNSNDRLLSYNYALSLMNVGEYSKALPLFEKCKDDEQQCPFAGLHFGRCLFEVGSTKEAKKILSQIIHKTSNVHVKRDVVEYMKQVKLT